MTSGPAYSGTGTFDGVLDVGETVSYEATFEITQAAVDAGGVKNTASVTAKDSKGNPLTPVSDSDTDIIQRNADMSVAKTITGIGGNTDGKIGVGDVIQYKVVVENTGNVTLTNIQVVDSLRLGSPTAAPVDNSDDDSPAGVDLWTQNQTLLPGESATYVAWYVIDDTAASSGQVINTATATADTPIPGDEGTIEKSDQISQAIDPIPSIAVTKVVTTPNDGGDGLDVGETVLYTITITNDGNTTLTGVSDPADTDIVKDINGVAFEQPYTNVVTYKGSSLDGSDPPAASFSNILEAGEVVTFEALLTINQAMVDAGGVVNTVSVEGFVGSEKYEDSASTEAIRLKQHHHYSDQGSEVIHVGSDDASAPVTRAEDRIKYTISIENTGNVTLTNLVVKDILTDGAGNALSLSESPGDTATPNEWVIDSLLPVLQMHLIMYSTPLGRLLRLQAVSATTARVTATLQMVQRLH